MNRYALWKYVVIGFALILGALYSIPNLFGESPAVQVSSAKSTIKIDEYTMGRVEEILESIQIKHQGISWDKIGLSSTIRVRLQDNETQLKARDALEQALNAGVGADDANYTIALNLLPRTPQWLAQINALPMYLGLDLRGGVHFLMQVDTQEAINKRLETLTSDARTLLREKKIRHAGIAREGDRIDIQFRDDETRDQALDIVRSQLPELDVLKTETDATLFLRATLSATAQREVKDNAIKQNISTLHNRVNELGVAEPVIQQQGGDRIVVQLPGVQDTARAKVILGRTATLEIRLVDQSQSGLGVTVPQRLSDGTLVPVQLRRDVVVTGDQLISANATFDQNQRPATSVRLDAAGGRAMLAATRENIGKPMAIVLYEKGKGEAISVATIQGEFSNQFQITGQFTVQETTDLALLIRSGSLAAPMEIIEERTIGPSLGADNIARGLKSTLYGFAAVALFMTVYYLAFGFVSVLALTVNMTLLIALLSLLQATLTLPGIAAIALTLGMAIDANVLINERIREELRNGRSPQQAIYEGYEKAFATILDSNVTTLIAGIALLTFGSGPVRGFAVVHCLGILTSVFSAFFVSRGITNLLYGSRKKLASVAIGQSPTGHTAA